ncbi:MAG: PQQ-binding-like beta-propeller repeat protein [Sphingomonas sp.]
MTFRLRTLLALTAATALAACGHHGGRHRHTPTLGERVPILASENAVDTDRTIADVQVLLPPASPNDSWAQPGGNIAKSMGHVALAADPSRLWSASIAGSDPKQRLGAAPIVADGGLYVMDVNAAVHAFDANTGAKRWVVAISHDKRNRKARFGGGVSFDNGKLFATDGLGDVVALDAKTGKELWRAKPGGPLRGAPSVAYGSIYTLTQDNQLFALSQDDGKVQWTGSGTLESQGVFGVAAPSAGRSTVVAGFSSGELNAFRYENGRSLWQDTLSRSVTSTSVSSLADIDASPVIDENRVYAIGQGGRMVALELLSGQRVWEENIAGISTPWLAGEWLFVVTDDAKMICLARGNGKIRWISDLGNFTNMKKHKGKQITWVGPILAGGRLIALNSQGQVVSVSPADGRVLSRKKGHASFSLPPVVANNTLYLLDDKGKLTAYR